LLDDSFEGVFSVVLYCPSSWSYWTFYFLIFSTASSYYNFNFNTSFATIFQEELPIQLPSPHVLSICFIIYFSFSGTWSVSYPKSSPRSKIASLCFYFVAFDLLYSLFGLKFHSLFPIMGILLVLWSTLTFLVQKAKSSWLILRTFAALSIWNCFKESVEVKELSSVKYLDLSCSIGSSYWSSKMSGLALRTKLDLGKIAQKLSEDKAKIESELIWIELVTSKSSSSNSMWFLSSESTESLGVSGNCYGSSKESEEWAFLGSSNESKEVSLILVWGFSKSSNESLAWSSCI